MPNPFKRRGSSFLSAEWKAWSIGLLGQLAAELADAPASTIALIGDIGSGKTTALDAYRERVTATRPTDVFLAIDAGTMSSDLWLELPRRVYVEIVGALGETLHDEVIKELKVSARSIGLHLEAHEMLMIMEGMVRRSGRDGQRVHVLVDECQRPAEHFEQAKDATRLQTWFEQLKNLAEAIARGEGCMVATATTSPWENGPAHVRDRFVELRAVAPQAAEIQAFVDEGVKHAMGDRPDKADAGLGAAIKGARPSLITIRELHDLLFVMWRKANQANAPLLGPEHLP